MKNLRVVRIPAEVELKMIFELRPAVGQSLLVVLIGKFDGYSLPWNRSHIRVTMRTIDA